MHASLCCVVVTCQPGTYLLNGVCYNDCPLTYYAANVTSVSGTTSLPFVGVCTRCNSVGVCARLFRLLLTVIGIIGCVTVLAVVAAFACQRGVCQPRPKGISLDSITAARLHSPRYITNGHIIAGLSSKPLLGGSDTDSSDESDAACELADGSNI